MTVEWESHAPTLHLQARKLTAAPPKGKEHPERPQIFAGNSRFFLYPSGHW